MEARDYQLGMISGIEVVAGIPDPSLPILMPATGTLGSVSLPPGSICETCFDAPATQLLPAPWGGEMGVCAGCAPGGAETFADGSLLTLVDGEREIGQIVMPGGSDTLAMPRLMSPAEMQEFAHIMQLLREAVQVIPEYSGPMTGVSPAEAQESCVTLVAHGILRRIFPLALAPSLEYSSDGESFYPRPEDCPGGIWRHVRPVV